MGVYMEIRKYILFLSIILFFACEEDVNPLYNCQDPNGNCYIDEPEGLLISSYSPDNILFDFDNNYEEIIEVIRTDNSNSNTFDIYEDDGFYLDTLNIIPGTTYNYSVRFKNTNGVQM